VTKQTSLVIYDYGQGGVYALIEARSEREIKSRFPELEIVRRRPEWMSEAQMSRLQLRMKFDIDQPTGWLAKLQKNHG